MAQVVEINLRLPNLRMKPAGGGEEKAVVNADVRFTKNVELDSIPKPGDILTMSVEGGGTFTCEVVQANWHDDKNRFVVACRYAKRSVPLEEYLAISNAPDWSVKALL